MSSKVYVLNFQSIVKMKEHTFRIIVFYEYEIFSIFFFFFEQISVLFKTLSILSIKNTSFDHPKLNSNYEIKIVIFA